MPEPKESRRFTEEQIQARFKAIGDQPLARQSTSVKLPEVIKAKIDSLDNPGAKLRQWIIEAMQQEGLLDDLNDTLDIQKYLDAGTEKEE